MAMNKRHLKGGRELCEKDRRGKWIAKSANMGLTKCLRLRERV